MLKTAWLLSMIGSLLPLYVSLNAWIWGTEGGVNRGAEPLIGELVFWRRDFGHRQGRPVMPGRRFGLPA